MANYSSVAYYIKHMHKGFQRPKLDGQLRTKLSVAAVVVAFAGLGVYLLLSSSAATNSVILEAENGTTSGNVGPGIAGGASGSALKFGINGTGGGATGGTSTDGLAGAAKKEIAMELVSSAENSSLDWKAQYKYIEWNVEGVASENRGYTAGIIGFCSGCGDMTELLQYYQTLAPGNVLQKYISAIQTQEKLGMGSVTQAGLGQAFINDWKTAANDAKFIQAQNDERDRVYFNPAVNQAKTDGLKSLGQFAYYDAIVVHGPGNDSTSFGGIRASAIKNAKPPSQGGNETTYLNAFMDARVKAMQTEEAHSDVTRIENAQRVFLKAGNLDLDPPLKWSVYGDPYSITTNPTP